MRPEHSTTAISTRPALPLAWIQVIFFASGFAALTYQICWQRLLFASFGVDIESITIIVSTFMLGLGVGALAGGWTADRFPARLLVAFALCEAAIGLFGLVSAELIRAVGDAFIESTLPVIATTNFLLLLVPTALMGATLPMLVAYVVRGNGNVGVSVGGLYFANTLGAATACLVVGFVWFQAFGLHAAILTSALVNGAIALPMLVLAGRSR